MAVAAGAVAVVGMASIAGAPAAWVLALRILVAGSSSSRVASPLMGEAVIGSIHEELQDRANTLINSGISIGVALSGPAALLVAEQWRLAWAAFALVGGVVVAWNAVVMPRKPVSDRRSEEATPADVPRLSVRYLIGPGAVPLFVAATGVGFASAAYWTFSRDLVVRSGDLSVTGSTLFWTVIGLPAGSPVTSSGVSDWLRRSEPRSFAWPWRPGC
jgi:predicted MFS family arabinose efflux permease